MRNVRDCSVCVVGGAGFLGSHLVNHLIEDRGCKVTVIDNLAAGRREFVHPKAIFEHHDITGSEEYLVGLFRCHEVEYVFNYAASPYIPDSFDRPLHVFNTTAFGALKVINAAQSAGCKGILQVSSAEIYGGNVTVNDEVCGYVTANKLGEEFPIIPHSSYGAAKAAIDAMVQVRWREAKTPVIALRQFNCVGERETHPYVVPEIVGQLALQQRIYVKDGNTWYSADRGVVRLGNNSFRDFLYAGDAVKIAVELLERGQFGEVYNLGSESGIKVYDLAKLIGKVMGFADVKVELDEVKIRPWEIWHLQSDNSKINAVVSDGNKRGHLVQLEDALRRTVKWFNDNGRRWCWEK